MCGKCSNTKIKRERAVEDQEKKRKLGIPGEVGEIDGSQRELGF